VENAMKWLLAGLTAMVLALTPGLAFAQDGQDDDMVIRIGADLRLAAGERAGTVIVIDGDALIEGEVADAVLVINGNAVVAGEISGQLTVIAGDIDLQATAQVKDVISVRGNILRSEGSLITGEIHERDSIGWLSGAAVFFSIAFWLGLTVALIGAGFIFAAIGGRQLREAARRMTAEPVNTILGVVFVAVAIPMLAGLAITTLVGIPFGIGLLIFLLPALWFLGYIVAAARLGGVLIGLRGPDSGGHPYAATVLGVVLLQLLVLVPVIGAVVALLAGLWGAGALAVSGYKAAGGRGVEPSAAQQAAS
jgi:hypothetical protein